MSDKVRVYVNATPLDVEPGTTAIDAVAAYNESDAALVRAGEKRLTDSRGLAITPNAPVHNGAIFRIVRARPAGNADNDPTHSE